jgi:hypothetical protein
MKFLALIYDDEKKNMSASEAEQKKVIDAYGAYEGWLATEQKGKKLAGEALQPTMTATTIRIRDGKRTLTDGPFAETREALGGFYMFEAKDLQEAIALAEKIPSAHVGSIEVRPILSFE